jgi:hypothetical protein
MEMRSVKILALGILGLAIAFLLPSVQNYVLFGLALVPFVLLVAGQMVLPRSKRIIRVWFDPIILKIHGISIAVEPGTPAGRLSGRDMVYGYFKQWHEFEIVTHRFLVLAAIGLLSLGAMALAWRVQDSFITGASLYYLLFFAWMVLVGMARRWLWERRMLRLQGLSIGDFRIARGSRPFYSQMRYHFVDPEGHYRGGCVDTFSGEQQDDMTLVFYDQNAPDRNIPASALMFHKLVWKEQSRPREESARAESA